MLLKAKVGPKGQAVIPKPIRDELGIQPGDDIYYSLHAGHAHLEKTPVDEQLDRFFASLPTTGPGQALSSKDYKQLLDEQYTDRFGDNP